MSYKLSIGQNTENILIPALSLQPLVENTIKHCCEASSAPVSILITSEWDRHDLCIQVLDNDPGIPENTLIKITESLEREETQDALTSSIGLVNVHRRLRLRFSTSSGLHIASGPEGTTITLTIPQNISREEGIICTEH